MPCSDDRSPRVYSTSEFVAHLSCRVACGDNGLYLEVDQKPFHLNGIQARVVAMLTAARRAGGFGLHNNVIRERLGWSGSQIRDLFYSRGRYHPAWRVLIGRGPSRGYLFFKFPEEDEPKRWG